MVNLLYALHNFSQYVATLTIASKKTGDAIAAPFHPQQLTQPPQSSGF
jgi:hypothetical protein